VFVSIQAGGFNTNADANTNATDLIKAAELGIVVVTFNYRVSTYGFMTNGDANSTLIDTNMGLLDQRKVLRWVQKYISHFGGDPNHVVIGGASAGAASVTYHLTAYDGQDEGLFVGSTAESQSFGPVRTAERSRYQFVNLAKNLSCWSASVTKNDDDRSNDAAVLACMRKAPLASIQQGATSIPYPEIRSIPGAAPPRFMWNPVIDGKLIKDLTYNRFSQGKFIRVPTIFGDATNEGSIYAPTNATTIANSNSFFRNNFPAVTDAQLAKLDVLWPNGNQSACPTPGCFFKQAADMYGDIRYICPGLFLARTLSTISTTPAPPSVWIYHFNALDPAQNASGLGVPHIAEQPSIWGPQNLAYQSPPSYLPGGVNAGTIPVMQGYWTSFIKTLNPSKARYNSSAEWVPWKGDLAQGRRLLVSTGGGTEMEGVSAQFQAKCAYQDTIALSLEQ
jgi:cholinesterase